MPNFYCEYCGQSFSSVAALTALNCSRHPAGPNKGKHSVYQGSEKPKYTCKYCGQQFRLIQTMTGTCCHRHPDGANRGRHAPAL
jgi:hypothetical protein